MIGQECLSSTHVNTLLMYRSFLQPEVCNRAAKHPLVGIRECETTMTRSLLSRNKNTCPRKNLVQAAHSLAAMMMTTDEGVITSILLTCFLRRSKFIKNPHSTHRREKKTVTIAYRNLNSRAQYVRHKKNAGLYNTNKDPDLLIQEKTVTQSMQHQLSRLHKLILSQNDGIYLRRSLSKIITQGYRFQELSSLLFLKAQQPMEQTMIRKTRNMTLTTATLFQSLLMLSSNPALHDWQLKHRTSGWLSHAAQSGFVDVVVVLVQLVGLTYVKLQESEGLQQPDYREKIKYHQHDTKCH